MHPEWIALCQRKAVWVELERLLQTDYIGVYDDANIKEIVAEDLPAKLNPVTRQAIQEVLQRVQQEIQAIEKEIDRFSMVRTEAAK